MVNETTHMGGGRRLFMSTRLYPKIATVALILHLFQLSPHVSDTVQSTSYYCKINPTKNMWELNIDLIVNYLKASVNKK